MRIRQGIEEKSRLGRLLVNRGYLSEGQLEDGLRVQRETGQRLGEVLVQAGWITRKELDR
ncbi:MAG: pilus assembly protein PilB, partial [Marinobacter sp.]|nr:pilus assembly protein PilB [Marinobacter sp.]